MPAHLPTRAARRVVGAALVLVISAGCGAGGTNPAPSDAPEGKPGPSTTTNTSPPPVTAPARVLLDSEVGPERSAALAELTERALAQVEQFWGPDSVATPVRLVLPADPAGFAAATGLETSDDVPAAVVGGGEAARLVVHPDAWDRLSPDGRLAVLTHEVTHLAMQGDGPVPWWLGEGLAEFTAHRSSSLPVAQIAGSALDRVRAGDLPRTWPERQAANPGDRWERYAMAWLACRFLAEEHSERALMEFYRAVSGGQAVAAALPGITGLTEQQTLEAWGDWLSELAAEPG